MVEPRYPNITVKLIGEDGNAFSILGRVLAALKMGGAPGEEIGEFLMEAEAGDYDHLLRTVMAWVRVSSDG
jgi:hypothetical protein